MELRSRRRCSSSRRQLGSPGGDAGADHISALPDDLLLLVLSRLRCVRAAARTVVLSRRWRGLWASLRHIVFRDLPFSSLEAALGRVSQLPTGLSLIEIRVPKQQMPVPELAIHSLFLAASQLEPEELVFDLPYKLAGPQVSLLFDLPCLHRTTSIVLVLPCHSLCVPAGVQLPTLEALFLSGCTADINALLSRCPRLRTLRLSNVVLQHGGPEVNSASLQELVMDCPRSTKYSVHIDAPLLKQLTVSLTLRQAKISVLAPMVEKVSWRCQLWGPCTSFGWRLVKVILETPERQGQLPSLQLHACHSSHTFEGEGTNIKQEVEKHMITEFSALEIHLTTKGHGFGALAFDLLGINRIGSSIQRLKIVLERSVFEEICPLYCPCDPPNWRFQTRSLTALEEVEINGFEGDEHEVDFTKLILK